MPASNAISGYNTLLQMADAGGTVYTTVAEVTKIGDVEFKADTAEVTHMTSPSSFREFISTLVDPGEIPFEFNFIPGETTQSNVSGLLFVLRTRAKRNWKIVFPNAVEWILPGYLTGFKVGAPIDDRLTGSATVKVTGIGTLV